MSTSHNNNSVYRIEPLRGTENFAVWKVRMRHILTNLGIANHVEPGAMTPLDPSLVATWKASDQKALTTIVLRVADNVLVHVETATTAKQAWAALSTLYKSKGILGITTTRRKMHQTWCAEDGNIEEHIHTMRTFQVALARLGRPINNDEFAQTLMDSLPGSWDPFINGLSDNIASNSEQLLAKILAEDTRRQSRSGQQESSTALAAVNKADIDCYECGKKGHFARDCKTKRRRDQDWNNTSHSHSNFHKSRSGHSCGYRRGGRSLHAHVAAESDSEEDFAFVARDSSLREKLTADDWLLDSACSRSIAGNRSDFSNYSECASSIRGIGKTAGIGRGTISLSFALRNSTRSGTLKDVLHCLSVPFNLISLARLTDAGYKALFIGDIVEICAPNGHLIAVGDKVSHMYPSRVRKPTSTPSTFAFPTRSWDNWHRSLGHLNMKSVQMLKAKNMVDSMDVDKSSEPSQCLACIKGKSHVEKVPRKSKRAFMEVGDMVYTDLWGPARVQGIHIVHYFISFTDARSTHSRLKFLRNKKSSTVLQAVKDYVVFIELQTGRKPWAFRFDNGKEYVAQEVLDWLKSQGIDWEITAPHSSSQNSTAERLNRTLLDQA